MMDGTPRGASKGRLVAHPLLQGTMVMQLPDQAEAANGTTRHRTVVLANIPSNARSVSHQLIQGRTPAHVNAPVGQLQEMLVQQAARLNDDADKMHVEASLGPGSQIQRPSQADACKLMPRQLQIGVGVCVTNVPRTYFLRVVEALSSDLE